MTEVKRERERERERERQTERQRQTERERRKMIIAKYYPTALTPQPN